MVNLGGVIKFIIGALAGFAITCLIVIYAAPLLYKSSISITTFADAAVIIGGIIGIIVGA